MAYKSGEDFLDKIYADMRNSEIVNHTALKSDKPEDKIKKYVDRLERIHEEADKHNKLDLIKRYYYNKYVIKEIPENYIELQKKIDRETGRNEIEDTTEWRKKLLLNVQNDQKASLDNWLNYFMSEDAMYPSWFKVYAFQGMLKLGKFDKEKGEFGRRTDSTIEPYLDFNREILARVYDTLKKHIGKEELSDEELKALSHGESFKKLYTYYLKCTNNTFKADGTDGIWIKYDQGDNYEPLWASLQGKNTGWCTAGEETAKKHIAGGDFYVYYTKDENGEYKNPRVAIRMEGKYHIGEVRGISKDQNLEPEMNEIVEKKLDEFPDKEAYLKKMHDMKLLTEIDRKTQDNIELTAEEVDFLYETKDYIVGFGWKPDPRIKEIKDRRNLVNDLNILFNGQEEFSGNLYFGDLTSLAGLKYFPKVFKGNITANSLISAEGMENLVEIFGNLELDSIKSAKGLENLQAVHGELKVDSIKSAKGLEKLQYVDSELSLHKLEDANGFNKLEVVGVLTILNLCDATGFDNLLEGSINAPKLKNFKGFTKLKKAFYIGGFAIEDSTGLENLEEVAQLDLPNLKTARGFTGLKRITSLALLQKLETADGFDSLEEISDNFHVPMLSSVDGFKSLKKVGNKDVTKDDIKRLFLHNHEKNMEEKMHQKFKDDMRNLFMNDEEMSIEEKMRQKYNEAASSGGIVIEENMMSSDEIELIMNGMLPERFWPENQNNNISTMRRPN